MDSLFVPRALHGIGGLGSTSDRGDGQVALGVNVLWFRPNYLRAADFETSAK